MLTRIATYVLIGVTVLLALLLDVYPLALDYRVLRPQFVFIVVIYWVYVLPQSTSMLLLLLLGIGQDVITGSPIGQHPLMLTLVCYLCLRTYDHFRHLSLWQQALWVFVLIALAQVLEYWVQGLAGRPPIGLALVLPALASATVWPFVTILLNALRRRYRIPQQL